MSQSHSFRRSSETGSAYIIALLVLVVLSILGLSLSLISQTEVQIGANELTAHRALYGAEGGVHFGISRMLTVNSSVQGAAMGDDGKNPLVQPLAFIVPETRLTLDSSGNVVPATSGAKFVESVGVSPFLPLREIPCDMCPAAEGDVQLVDVNHALVSSAGRRLEGADEDDPNTLTAQKQLYLMVGLQPWWTPRWEALADDEAIEKVVQDLNGAQ
jgi:hypothetical protein